VTGSDSLPTTWAETRLEDVAEIILGQSPPGLSYNTDGIGLPFFQGSAEFGDLYPEIKKWTTKPTKFARAGDVLLSVRAPVGPTNLAPLDCAIGRGVAAIRAVDEIMPKYLLYALRATESALASKSTGTTFDAVPGSVVRGHLIRLAPTAEQRRIVAAIEEQFSRIDAGVEALQRARRNLQRMRAAVLRQAFERGLGDDELGDEPAEILLREILEERRRAWESGRGSGKYREPAPPSLRRTRRKIPDGWVWASLEQLTDGARKIAYGVLQPGRHVENGVPFVRVGDVNEGVVAPIHRLKRVDPMVATLYPRTRLSGGEVLLTLVGSIGRSAIVPAEFVGGNVARAIAVIPTTALVEARYISLCLSEREAVAELVGLAHEVARKTLNLEDVKSFPIPLPPLAVQRQIVDEIARQTSVIQATYLSIEETLRKADSLRAAALNSAFRGRLATHDPNDEPASVLLDRIKNPRATPAPKTTLYAGGRTIE